MNVRHDIVPTRLLARTWENRFKHKWHDINNMFHVNPYVIKHGQRLRCGYTTGSCAAGAARAAALALQTGVMPVVVEVLTPAGVTLQLTVVEPVLQANCASCGIRKDAGDDPDTTDGMLICAEVRPRADGQINIDGGVGIGRITRAGFWGAPGAAAINPVPRRMIRAAVAEVAPHGWDVLIYAPRGAEMARKTFNPNLGIVGGISILGTTGIVQPMSEDALKTTIYLAIDAVLATGAPELLLFLGNYGEQLIRDRQWTLPRVKISNFIGESVAYCQRQGARKVTLIGHIGKLSKVALGAFNTHNQVCDVRLEAFVYYLALAGAPTALLRQINACQSSEEALTLTLAAGYAAIPAAMRQGCVDRLRRYLKDDRMELDVILYSLTLGVL